MTHNLLVVNAHVAYTRQIGHITENDDDDDNNHYDDDDDANSQQEKRAQYYTFAWENPKKTISLWRSK